MNVGVAHDMNHYADNVSAVDPAERLQRFHDFWLQIADEVSLRHFAGRQSNFDIDRAYGRLRMHPSRYSNRTRFGKRE